MVCPFFFSAPARISNVRFEKNSLKYGDMFEKYKHNLVGVKEQLN